MQKTDGQCYIWGRKAKFLAVEYTDHEGKKRKSKLLLRWELMVLLKSSTGGSPDGLFKLLLKKELMFVLNSSSGGS